MKSSLDASRARASSTNQSPSPRVKTRRHARQSPLRHTRARVHDARTDGTRRWPRRCVRAMISMRVATRTRRNRRRGARVEATIAERIRANCGSRRRRSQEFVKKRVARRSFGAFTRTFGGDEITSCFTAFREGNERRTGTDEGKTRAVFVECAGFSPGGRGRGGRDGGRGTSLTTRVSACTRRWISFARIHASREAHRRSNESARDEKGATVTGAAPVTVLWK